jgi:hypothetical protein
MRTRTQYLPIIEAEAGMILADALRVVKFGHLRLSLPAGHLLTPDNLHQMTAHRTEYIFISALDTRSDEQVAVDTALVAHRAMDIFAGADLSDPTMSVLFDQILAYRNS